MKTQDGSSPTGRDLLKNVKTVKGDIGHYLITGYVNSQQSERGVQQIKNKIEFND